MLHKVTVREFRGKLSGYMDLLRGGDMVEVNGLKLSAEVVERKKSLEERVRTLEQALVLTGSIITDMHGEDK